MGQNIPRNIFIGMMEYTCIGLHCMPILFTLFCMGLICIMEFKVNQGIESMQLISDYRGIHKTLNREVSISST